ncbi:hypothetical protein MASR2M78_31600 [Treponema sp.]
MADQELLTRVRIPLGDWDYTVHRRLGQARWNDEHSAVFTFIARAQKGILSEVRLAFAGISLLRDREIDNAISGQDTAAGAKEAAVIYRTLAGAHQG